MRSSGRSDDGKNWRGTQGLASSAAMKHATVSPMVTQRARMAVIKIDRNPRINGPSVFETCVDGFLSSHTPSSGAKRTATSQESIRASPTTTKIENVYSLAAL